MIRPYKFQIVAIVQEVDEDDRVIGERPVTAGNGQPIEVFGVDGLVEFAKGFDARLGNAEPTKDPPDTQD